MGTVKCSDFVKRQTKNSGYSHFEGSWKELEQITEKYLNGYSGLFVRPGYRDGVVLIDLPGWMFKCAIVKLDDNMELHANYAPRKEGEAPFIRVAAKANKQEAAYAQVVLYRWDVLAEDNDRSSNADWEIVAVKARMTFEEEPMDPYTMARNFLHMAGGTKGEFTAEQFAKSIVYWNNHCMCMGKPKWWRRVLNWFKNR